MAGPDYSNSQYVPEARRPTTRRDRLRDAESSRDPLGHLGRRSGGHRFCHQSLAGSSAHPRSSSGRQGKMAGHHRANVRNRYLAKGLRRCSSRAFPARNTDRESLQILARSSRHLVRSAGANPDAPEIGASESPRSGRRIKQTRRRRAYLRASGGRLDCILLLYRRHDWTPEDRGQKPSDRTRQRPPA